MKCLSIEFTYDCNYHCPWCIKSDDLNTKHGALSPIEFEKIMHYIISEDIESVCFCGAEPLYHPDFLLNAISEIRKTIPRIRITIATNGTGITKNITDYFNTENINVFLSVEANGYKGLEMLVENAVEPYQVIENMRNLKHLEIRSVRPEMTNFAVNSLLLHNIFPLAQIQVTPDRNKLALYTLSDIKLLNNELEYLYSLDNTINNWFDLISSYRRKCNNDIYRYDLKTGNFLHTCPLNKHTNIGCYLFSNQMKQEVFDAYCLTVAKILKKDKE